MRKLKPDSYQVFVPNRLRMASGEYVTTQWVARSGQTDIEMAQSLTTDLYQWNVPWQIRDQNGVVVESSQK